jgi:cyanophycin synthetase
MFNNNILLLIIILILVVLCYKYIFKNKDAFLNFNNKDFKLFFLKNNMKIENDYLIWNNKKYKLYKNKLGLNLNPKKIINLTTDKEMTKKILIKNNIATSKYLMYKKKKNINNFINEVNLKLNFPLVIKPTNGYDSIDVFLNIKSSKELKELILKLKKKYEKLIIEEMEEGDLFRILLVNDNIIDILRRRRSFIIGNGVNTIEELIEIKNIKIKKKMKINNLILFPIKEIDYRYLNSEGYNVKDILKQNQKLYLSNFSTRRSGGTMDRIDINKVHKDHLNTFIKTSTVTNCVYCGIDYISKDLTKPIYKNGNILEINSHPLYNFHKKKKNNYLIITKIFDNIKDYLKNIKRNR